MAASALQSAAKVAETITWQETPQREGMRHCFQSVGFAVEVNIGFGTQPTAQSVHAEACCIMVALHAEVTAGRCAVGNIEKATGQQRQEFLDESALPYAGFKIKLGVAPSLSDVVGGAFQRDRQKLRPGQMQARERQMTDIAFYAPFNRQRNTGKRLQNIVVGIPLGQRSDILRSERGIERQRHGFVAARREGVEIEVGPCLDFRCRRREFQERQEEACRVHINAALGVFHFQSAMLVESQSRQISAQRSLLIVR